MVTANNRDEPNYNAPKNEGDRQKESNNRGTEGHGKNRKMVLGSFQPPWLSTYTWHVSNLLRKRR